jgi:hypothetical protein
MNRRIKSGIILGMIAGIIDAIPMILQKLPTSAILSAFAMWTAAGLFISTTELPVKSILKGIIISLLMLLPTAILIAAQEPISLIPVCIMTLLLGSALGYMTDKMQGK